MASYRQQRPVVIRQGFAQFEDLISPNDLAGLACEEEVESRLVYKKDGQWQTEVGPFESYERFGKEGWTLVVQAVNHYSPEVAELVKPFAYIPKWRLDDVMISYATLVADFAGSYFSKTKCALDLQALDEALEMAQPFPNTILIREVLG